MPRVGTCLVMAVMLSACVSATKTWPIPRIEPDIGALLLDQTPIWESQRVVAAPVTANNRRFHLVAVGDTGIGIARAYGIAWQSIVDANALTEPYILKVGQRLRLPGSGIPSIEARAAAFRIDISDIASGANPARVNPLMTPPPPVFDGRFAWPASGRVIDRFGPAGEGLFNQGIEIAVPPQSDIRAAASGVVAYVGNGGSAGYGGLILIRHSGGWISAYGRASQASVTRGQQVDTGDAIGRVGRDVRPRLHFQLRRNRTPVDPVRYLPAR